LIGQERSYVTDAVMTRIKILLLVQPAMHKSTKYECTTICTSEQQKVRYEKAQSM